MSAPGRDVLGWALLLAGAAMAILAWATLVGLGLARFAQPAALVASATLLVFGPGLAVAFASPPERRTGRLGAGLLVWAVLLQASLPIYFPGERRDAVGSGLALLTGDTEGRGIARTVAEALPEEPASARAETQPPPPTPAEPVAPPPLDDHEIALPYEGEGRRLSVPVVFQQGGRTVETFMMLDTGATYTTLPLATLAQLGVVPNARDPELTLHTANGERTARVVLLDRVWLGDLPLEGVAITACEDCVSEENAGLLGLNVAGGYNVTIDADRREVIFSQRRAFDRHLDVRPFSTFTGRYRAQAGRVVFSLELQNRSRRLITAATGWVKCGEDSWPVELGPVEAGATETFLRPIPQEEPCDGYRIGLDRAWW